MNQSFFSLLLPFLFVCILFTACSSQNTANLSDTLATEKKIEPAYIQEDTNSVTAPSYRDPFEGLNIDAQLMQVMRRIFQDSKGNIWFVGDEVFAYDGKTLHDLSDQQVFEKTTIRQIKEDAKGNIWFAGHSGLIKFDPESETHAFQKFSMEDGLVDNDIWSMEIDSKGIIWVGTFEGVNKFDGKTFTPFELPASKVDDLRGVSGPYLVSSIIEDSKGNMWFGTNGGAYIYDGDSLRNLSEKDGLCHNSVNDILEDQRGDIWFATHHLGICRWNGEAFSHITDEAGIKGTEAWSLYEDASGDIWFPIEHEGIYRYDLAASKKAGKPSLTNFHKENGLLLSNVHTVVKDQNGVLWFGGFGGLYRSEGKAIINMPKEGPWGK